MCVFVYVCVCVRHARGVSVSINTWHCLNHNIERPTLYVRQLAIESCLPTQSKQSSYIILTGTFIYNNSVNSGLIYLNMFASFIVDGEMVTLLSLRFLSV